MPSGTRMAAATLLLLPFVLLAEAVAGRAVFFERDIFSYWVPAMEAFVRAVAEGAWPLWDPLTNFGRPLLADPNLQIAYPPTWLNLILSPGTYYTLFVAAHCAWAGLGAFRLGRAWGLGLAGAWWAGALWMLSGPFLSLASLFHHFASASWMPWVLVALEGVLRRPGPRSSVWLAAAAAGAALAGSADFCIMIGAAALARAAFAAASRGQHPGAVTRATIGALAASCALAGLLSAVQWWGTLAQLAVGSRAAMGAAANMYWSAHPASLLDAVFPGLVAGLPLGTGWRAAIFEARGPLLRSLYVGVPALVLALCALAAGRWPMRWLAAALAAAFLVVALGRFTPVYPLIVGLPLVRLLRYPVKYLVPATLFLSLLSGAGIDALREEWDSRTRRRMALIAVGVVAATLLAAVGAVSAGRLAGVLAPSMAPSPIDVAGRVRAGFVRVALLAAVCAAALLLRAARGRNTALLAIALLVALGDVFLAARDAIRLGPPELLRHRPPILDAFPEPRDRRLYTFQYGTGWLNEQFTRPPAGWDPEWAWALGHAERLAPPIPTRFGLSGSFDGDFTGLTPVALTRLAAAVHEARDEPAGLRLLQMASVTDVVSFEDTMAGLPPRAERWSVYTKPVRVFTVPDPLPRAYLVSGTLGDAPPGEASIVTAPAFDARREVALDASSGFVASAPAADTGHARILDRRSDRIRVAVSARVPAVLVVTESFDAGWRAWLDGAPAPVWRANAIFRGVPVPEGDHLVEMRYRPPSVAWGAAGSAVGVALAGVLIRRRSA